MLPRKLTTISIEPHLLPLRRSQFALDPNRLSLYVSLLNRMCKTIANDLVYPETCNRSLESIETLFSTPSPFFWKMEQAYELHGNVLAERGISKNHGFDDDGNETGSIEKPEEQMIA
jgi:hypothetical protein